MTVLETCPMTETTCQDNPNALVVFWSLLSSRVMSRAPTLLSFPPHVDALFHSGRSGPIWTDKQKFSHNSSGNNFINKFYQSDSAAEHRNCHTSLNNIFPPAHVSSGNNCTTAASRDNKVNDDCNLLRMLK